MSKIEQTPIALVSVHVWGKTERGNRERADGLQMQLHERDLSHKRIDGRYLGERDETFVIPLSRVEEERHPILVQLVALPQRPSVAFVDRDSRFYRVREHGALTFLGYWQSVEEKEGLTRDHYRDTDRYYVVKGERYHTPVSETKGEST